MKRWLAFIWLSIVLMACAKQELQTNKTSISGVWKSLYSFQSIGAAPIINSNGNGAMLLLNADGTVSSSNEFLVGDYRYEVVDSNTVRFVSRSSSATAFPTLVMGYQLTNNNQHLLLYGKSCIEGCGTMYVRVQ